MMRAMALSQPVAAPPSSRLPRWSALKRVADAQRQALLALLVAILVIPLSIVLGGAVGGEGVGTTAIAAAVVAVGARVWMLVAVYRVMKALESSVAWLWAIGAFLPNLIGLIVLAVCSARATKRLKGAGLEVGLLGAKLADRPPPGFPCEELAGDFS